MGCLVRVSLEKQSRVLSMSRALLLQRYIGGGIGHRANRCDSLSALDKLTSVRNVSISVEAGVQQTYRMLSYRTRYGRDGRRAQATSNNQPESTPRTDNKWNPSSMN